MSSPSLTRIHQHANFLPYLSLLFGVLGLSISAILVRWAAVPGAASGFYRMAIATGVMALPVLRQARAESAGRSTARLGRRHVLMAVLAGAFFASDLTSWNTGVLIGNAANATLLANTAPLWVGLGALLLFKERLGLVFWMGLLLAMAGAGVIVGRDFLAHPGLGAGDLLGLLAGVFYGGFFLATQRAREGLSALVSWWISAAASSAVLLIYSLALRQPLLGYAPAQYATLVALALITQVGGYVSVNYALGHLPASLVSPSLLGQPVLTAVLAVPLLGEPLSWAQVAGGLMVLGGIWIVHQNRGDA